MRLKTKDLPEVKNALREQQDNRCAICRIDFDPDNLNNMCLDHDHKTGEIRGLLCRNCNQMEGKVKNCAQRAKRGGTEHSWVTALLQYWSFHMSSPSGVWYPTHKTDDEKRLLRNKRARLKRKADKAT